MPYDRILTLIERYGIFLALASAYGILSPDFGARTSLDDLREANIHAAASANIIKQLIWTGLFAAFFVCFLRETAISSPLLNRWGLIFILLGATAVFFASTLWSEAKAFTTKRTIFQIFLIFDVFFGVYFSCKHKTFNKNIRFIALLISIFTIISIAKGTGFTEIGLASYQSHKNSFGAIILAVFSIYTCLKLRYTDLYILIPLCIFLAMSLSKTSIALSTVILLLSLVNFKFSKFIFSAAYYTTVTIFLIIPMTASYLNILWYPSQDKDPSFMTGRGLVWQTLYPTALDDKSINLGHGFGAYFGTGRVPDALNINHPFLPSLVQSHNSYLDLALQLGFPLSILLTFILFTLVRRIDVKQLYIAGFAFLIYGISEAAFFRDQQGIWIMFITVFSWSLVKISIFRNGFIR